jgi:hypothetical protein
MREWPTTQFAYLGSGREGKRQTNWLVSVLGFEYDLTVMVTGNELPELTGGLRLSTAARIC